MADEHDSWLEGIGVKVGDFFGGAAQAVEDTASSAAQAVSSAAHTAYDVGASAVNTVETTASSAAKTVQSTASSAWNTAGDYANKAVEAVKGGASAAWEGAKEVGREVEDGAETVVKKVKDAGSAVVEGVEKTASSAWDTAKEIGGEVVEGVEDAGSTILEEVEDAGSAVWDGAKEVVEDVENGASAAWDKTKEVGGELVDGAKEIADEAWKVASDPDQWSGVGTPVRKMLEEEAAQGHKVDARGLSSGELSDAKVIFGDSIDYSKVVVDGGSIASLKASRTIGNTIHLTPDLFDPDSSETSTEGKRILVHELTHVWQYQHEGWTYAPKALWAQAKAAIKGDRNGAYDWTRLIGTPFEQWNPEAQAEAVEDYNRALHNVNAGKGTRKDFDDLALLQEYVEKLVAGPA